LCFSFLLTCLLSMNSIPAAIVIVSVIMTAGAAIIVAIRPMPKMLNPTMKEAKM